MKWIILFVVVGTGLSQAKVNSWQKYKEAIRHLSSDTIFRPLVEAHLQTFREAERTSRYHPEIAGRSFACPGGPSPTVPTSVHSLRPGDINVVAALGDSLTAANGADAWTIIGCLTEYRGTSWSIGGDRSLSTNGVTLPNIFRYFNPNIYGFSTGSGDRNSSGSRLNVAEAGAESRDMVEQANILVDRLKTNSRVNFQEDWKLITFFIGGNDLCRFCNDEGDYTDSKYGSRVEEALEVLHRNIPRALVQVVTIFDIGPLSEMGGLICGAVHIFACDCVRSEEKRQKVTQLTRQFQEQLKQITSDSRFSTREDFTIVLQSFFQEAHPPRMDDETLDRSFFAPDCFHFSRKGHQMTAINLWNQMFKHEKDNDWDFDAEIYCPKQGQYIATSGNE